MQQQQQQQQQEMNTSNANDDIIKSQPQAFPDHWSLFLHCTICFGYFHNPHTLECGHSFCKRCLKRLAEIARDDNPDIRVRRLCVSCPTCRHPFRIKPAIRGRVRTCIVLKHLVDLWKQECKILASSSPRHFRSICSQTEPPEGDNDNNLKPHPPSPSNSSNTNPTPHTPTNHNNSDLQEEFLVHLPLGDAYFESVMRHVTEASCEIDQDLLDDTTNKIGGAVSGVGGGGGFLPIFSADRFTREANSSSDSESSISSSGDEIGGRGTSRNNGGEGGGGSVGGTGTHRTGSNRSSSNISIPEFFGHLSLSGAVFSSSDWFPARCLLIAVWFVYSLLIVALAEAFLPYVMIFTIFFFLIVLK